MVRAALVESARDDVRRAGLAARILTAREALAPLGASCHGSPIIPLVLGSDARAMAVAGELQAAGFDVRGIRPPTVPEGTARLRIVITANVGTEDVLALADFLAPVLKCDGKQ